MAKLCVTDFLIIGAGVIGLSIAAEIQRRFKHSLVTIIDKENSVGQHASGRNSGVLHSGIYYTADSLKAKFTRDGNQLWQQFCDLHKIPVDQCGKLIVATQEQDIRAINILIERGKKNGVEVQSLASDELRLIEPRVFADFPGLFVPSTSTVDPHKIIYALEKEFVNIGGRIYCNCAYEKNLGKNRVNTSTGVIEAGYIINCAGLYADKIAHDFSFGENFTILPFKGLYLYATGDAPQPSAHIYPVPDLNNPFLGIHFTRTMYGETKIGPTAIPAFWRENYSGLENVDLRELTQVVGQELKMFINDSNNFRSLAWQVVYRQTKQQIIREADRLMSGTQDMLFKRWGRPGIRAQLFNRKDNKLEMDFIIENDDKSLHVLNAVSPAFTCALPFATYVIDLVENSKNFHNTCVI